MQSIKETAGDYEIVNGAHLGHIYEMATVEHPTTAVENNVYSYTNEPLEVNMLQCFYKHYTTKSTYR